jgi:hypothetical protein
MSRLVLLPQGGLGNQLIQYGYAQSLAARSGCLVEVNPILLGRSWARLRGVSFRALTPWLASYWPVLQGRHRRGVDFVLSKARCLRGTNLNESWTDGALTQALDKAHKERRYWLLGYFQRHQAFSAEALPLWQYVAEQVLQVPGMQPHPHGHVALHVRLGDYLLPDNQRLFAWQPVEKLVERALHWRDLLGGDKPISVFTDSPDLLSTQLKNRCTLEEQAQLNIQSNASADADFLAMLRYRHIVGSNSTFSLCAGQLSWLLWGKTSGASLLLPARWYNDDRLDKQQRKELDACAFTRTTIA